MASFFLCSSNSFSVSDKLDTLLTSSLVASFELSVASFISFCKSFCFCRSSIYSITSSISIHPISVTQEVCICLRESIFDSNCCAIIATQSFFNSLSLFCTSSCSPNASNNLCAIFISVSSDHLESS
jgi:hypothetical protein